MNGRTGTIAAARAPGSPGGRPAAGRGRPVSAREGQWPGMRPWPLFSALGPVGALLTAPALARAFTGTVLDGWDLARPGDLADDSALVVGELANNVVTAAAGYDGSPVCRADDRQAELWLRLMSDRAQLRIEVWDNLPASVGAPVLRRPGPGEEHGRGLELVSHLSRSWGWDPVPDLGLKVVWALLEVR
jgi:hypothetical protein